MDNKQLAVFLAFAGLIVVRLSYSFFLGGNLSGSKPLAGQNHAKDSSPLSEFQVNACKAADNSGACQTRLPGLS